MILQLGKFLVVGVSAAGIEFGSFLLLLHGAGVSIILSNGLSFFLGLMTSFMLNRQWAFFTHTSESFVRKAHHQFGLYCILSGVNLLLTIGLVQIFVAFAVTPALAKFLAMGITSAWNFILYRRVIFKRVY